MTETTRTETLQELINSMQAMQSAQEEETTRLRRRLQWLETRRREFFDILAQQGSDPDTIRKLDDTEQQLENMNQMLTKVETELKQSLLEIRQRILDLRNQELVRIQQEREAIRKRRENIRTQLLPQAQNRVALLMEEDAAGRQQDGELQRRMEELSRLDQFTNLT